MTDIDDMVSSMVPVWKPRCPKCFSRDLTVCSGGFNEEGKVKQAEFWCKECEAQFPMGDAELNMPYKGGYLDVPANGTEEEI